MASDQARRRDENASGEREIHVEKDRVPKLTTHFESLAEKSGGDQERSREGGGEDEDRQRKIETPSLEEISKHRAMAQQNSVEAIRGAEERYAQKTETSNQGLGVGAATASFVKEMGEQTTDYARQKAIKAKEAAIETGKVAASKASNVIVQVKDTAIETGKSPATKAGEVAIEAKDKVATAGLEAAHYVSEKTVGAAKEAGGYVAKKAVSAKDTVAERPMEFTGKKEEEAKKDVESKKSTESKVNTK